MDPAQMVVLVTGATSGFGEAVARRFLEAGARVVGVGRRGERLHDLASRYPLFLPVTLDVRDREGLESALAALPPSHRDVDLLVNNAGLALGLEPAYRADLADWDTMIDTNCRALVTVTRAVLPGMVERGRGHVVNLGSVAGTYPYPGGNVYGATKAFVQQFSLNLRADLLGHPIRVTVIEPGLAETEFSLVRFKGDAARASTPYQGVQALSADDVAESVHWVATLPAHVNVNRLELMPTAQAFGPFGVARS